jgi:hypothetical protein
MGPQKGCHCKSLPLARSYQEPNAVGKQARKGIPGHKTPSASW